MIFKIDFCEMWDSILDIHGLRDYDRTTKAE